MQNTPHAARPLRLLIAEDVEINRDILSDVLAEKGHVLVFASHGGEAVDHMRQQAFDLVLMDIQMPVMDGLEAARQIRQLPGPGRHVPIVALSATVGPNERQRFLDAGMNGWLVKPFDWDRVDEALARYGAAAGEPASPAAAEAGQPAPVLVNPQVLSQLRRRASAHDVRDMVRTGMEAYRGYCEAMLTPAAVRADIVREAHKLRGSAGTLGLMGISSIAGKIEDCEEDDAAVLRLAQSLMATITQTGTELVALGELPEPAAGLRP